MNAATPKRSPHIRYVKPAASHVATPNVKGHTYSINTPDTLDLAVRARHMLHALTACTDPEANAEIYWHADFGQNPMTAWHDGNDWCEFKFYAPSALLRQACGWTGRADVEWHRMMNLVQMQAPNGLMYIPLAGRPWNTTWGGDDRIYKRKGVRCEHILGVHMLGRMLEACGAYAHMTGDERWLDRGRRIVDGIPAILLNHEDTAYAPSPVIALNEHFPAGGPIPPPTHTHGTVWLGVGLAGFYRMTGYEPARDAAHRIARFYARGPGGFVGPNGEFQNSHISSTSKPGGPTHFHTNTLTRLLLLYAGQINDDRELIDLAETGYAYGKAHGETLMGFFPEAIVEAIPDYYEGWYGTSEFCEVAEMILLAAELSKTGQGDYWDDADRWLRNMFAEAQLLDTDWAYTFSETHGIRGRTAEHPYNVTEGVPEMFRGAVGGWIAPNDWQGEPDRSVMTCCLGNAAIMLYKIWRDMITEDTAGGRLNVHLLMNRASAWADIHSHIPYRGQVDVKLKRDVALALRIPEWTTPEACDCVRNDQAVDTSLEGRYMVVVGCKGDTITLTCPIKERSDSLRIMGKDYKVVVRGNEIVDVDPPGQRKPIFHRPEYRTDETQWHTVDRFISDETLDGY